MVGALPWEYTFEDGSRLVATSQHAEFFAGDGSPVALDTLRAMLGMGEGSLSVRTGAQVLFVHESVPSLSARAIAAVTLRAMTSGRGATDLNPERAADRAVAAYARWLPEPQFLRHWAARHLRDEAWEQEAMVEVASRGAGVLWLTLAYNEHAGAQVLTGLARLTAKGQESHLGAQLAERTDLPDAAFEILLARGDRDPDGTVEALAIHSTDPDRLMRLAADSGPVVRSAVGRNPHTPHNALADLLVDADPLVRAEVLLRVQREHEEFHAERDEDES